jgi:membrane-associated phospholipid phosphatase
MSRPVERLLLAYFVYVAALASWLLPRQQVLKTWALVACVAAAIALLRRAKPLVRDLMPLAFTLAAYREMNWFTPAVQDHHLERSWILWDRWLLDQHRLRAAIELAGPWIPGLLELCYLLVYAVAPVSIVLLYRSGCSAQAGRLWLAYFAGTLGAYALFPYFPSEPPRTVFSGADLPQVATVFRKLNLLIVGGYGIHSSVFPSAHVSSAFSAAWGLMSAIPQRPWIGRLMAVYAFLVALATVYGRYHYAVDALAGAAMSVLAVIALRLIKPSDLSDC